MPLHFGRRERLADLPISMVAKVLLLNEMLGNNVTSSELARRMATTKQEIDRLIDLRHATKIDRIGKAMHALGRVLEIVVA